ncbi:hypothetical protein L0F63_004806 [Massospora cicadina]|nr:hypothetical protein L0F63_004806 [Massospora cicadina]
MAQQWKRWLGKEQLETVSKAGYYSINHSPTLKVIVLNNLFYTYNYYALLRPTDSDPSGMLKWLIGELQQVEEGGGWAYLVSHIPPGSTDFYPHWSDAYDRIVERYAHLIGAQFYGHLHTDDTVYLAPSIAPLNGINPSYRVYKVAKSSYWVIDYHQYYADLKYQQTWGEDMRWEVMYSARDAYALDYHPPTLDPKFWHLVTTRMEDSLDRFNLFRAHHKAKGLVDPTCDGVCRNRTICSLRAARSWDNCAIVVPFT